MVLSLKKKSPIAIYVGVLGVAMSVDGNLENYIYIENYSEEVWLSDVSTEVYFKNKKERTHYRTMGITDNLFNLEIEDLSTQFPLEYRLNRPNIPSLSKSKKETIEEKTETGFFIGRLDMEKLKCLKLVKIKVKYRWKGKRIQTFGDLNSQTSILFASAYYHFRSGEG